MRMRKAVYALNAILLLSTTSERNENATRPKRRPHASHPDIHG